MYARVFEKAGEVHRFSITVVDASGWEIRREVGNRVIARTRYTDWHKVERARLLFSREAADLADTGWTEA